MQIKNASVFLDTFKFKITNVDIQSDIIVSLGDNLSASDTVLDATGLILIPGLTDLHFHGCNGYDFCDGNSHAIQEIANYEAKNGITQICPATMACPESQLMQIAVSAKKHNNTKGAILCGINMEGPFITPEKRGAQNKAYLCAPNLSLYQKAQQASGGLIKIVDLSLEEKSALEFIRATSSGTILSIAHTGATYEQTLKAIDAGATHVTHLYNAMSPFHHRAPGVIGAACDCENVHVELICDGIHIHPAAIRTTFKMFTEDRIILISDSMRATGLADGEYTLGGQTVTKTGSLATLHDGTLAGTVSNLMDCVKTVVNTVHLPLETALKCAAVNPAKELGIYDKYGSITPGKKANLVLLNPDLSIHTVIVNGTIL